MFICVDMEKDVNVGEFVILRNDVFTEGLCAYSMRGERIGVVCSNQAEGCLDFWTMATRINDDRVLCKAVIKGGRLLILSTESKIFEDKKQVASVASIPALALSYR